MVIVKLVGGLGNQMFQYAAGISLSVKLNTNLFLDISAYSKKHSRDYRLNDAFNVKESLADGYLLKKIHSPHYRMMNWLLSSIDSNNKIGLIRRYCEPHFHYTEEFKYISNNTYLEGYWQSERYFSPYADKIRESFQFSSQLSSKAKFFLNKIQSGQATPVSLHIRRGDYVSNPSFNKTFGVCGIDYYENAINKIKSKVGDIFIFIFSDDITWVKKNIKFNTPYSIVDSEITDYETIQLMSMCSHHIIANSSFSWWGAWLNKNNKIVIAPKKWFDNSERNTKDLIPKDWIQI